MKLLITVVSLLVSVAGFAQNFGSSYQDYNGAIGPNDYCSTCALENRLDVPYGSGKNRFLLNNDRRSIDARCQELGWDYGVALERYAHEEWCRYKNARTRTWDRQNRQWVFGACTPGNVKMARCYRR